MRDADLYLPASGTLVAYRGRKYPLTGGHTPRENCLLAALPPGDYERLLPDLEFVLLPLGSSVHDAGDREQYLYFVTGGIVARVSVMESGASKEFAVTGREGVIGIATFLGGDSTPSRAVVVSAGHAYRLPADRLRQEFEHVGPMPRLLLRYTYALMTQIGQIVACSRHHTLEQRLCRWILSCLDRLPSNELTMTQDLIAHMLGVRREGVTDVAGRLQKVGLLRYSRGHIAVLDRQRLEAHACECYAVVKRTYDRLNDQHEPVMRFDSRVRVS